MLHRPFKENTVSRIEVLELFERLKQDEMSIKYHTCHEHHLTSRNDEKIKNIHQKICSSSSHTGSKKKTLD